MSIRPEYAQRILDGRKKVELRRRRPNLPTGSRIWIYATLPLGKVVGAAIVDEVVTAEIDVLWKMFRREAGISWREYDQYVRGSSTASAIRLSSVSYLEEEIALDSIRKRIAGFQPPQFFSWLRREDPLLEMLLPAIKSTALPA